MSNQRYSTSLSYAAQGAEHIAGGVVSLNRKVDPAIVFVRAQGSTLYDADGNEYIDYHAAFAAHFLGHNHPRVNAAVRRALHTATCCKRCKYPYRFRMGDFRRGCFTGT